MKLRGEIVDVNKWKAYIFQSDGGELPLFKMTVHTNKSSMDNILSFEEVSNITGVQINIYTSKERVINVHIKDRKIIHLGLYRRSEET